MSKGDMGHKGRKSYVSLNRNETVIKNGFQMGHNKGKRSLFSSCHSLFRRFSGSLFLPAGGQG